MKDLSTPELSGSPIRSEPRLPPLGSLGVSVSLGSLGVSVPLGSLGVRGPHIMTLKREQIRHVLALWNPWSNLHNRKLSNSSSQSACIDATLSLSCRQNSLSCLSIGSRPLGGGISDGVRTLPVEERLVDPAPTACLLDVTGSDLTPDTCQDVSSRGRAAAGCQRVTTLRLGWNQH